MAVRVHFQTESEDTACLHHTARVRSAVDTVCTIGHEHMDVHSHDLFSIPRPVAGEYVEVEGDYDFAALRDEFDSSTRERSMSVAR